MAEYTDGFDMQRVYQIKKKNQMKHLSYFWPEQLDKLWSHLLRWADKDNWERGGLFLGYEGHKGIFFVRVKIKMPSVIPVDMLGHLLICEFWTQDKVGARIVHLEISKHH